MPEPATQQITVVDKPGVLSSKGADELALALADVAGQLAPSSRRLYASDIKHFAGWLTARSLDILVVSRSDMVAYRQHLAESYAKVTAARMLTVAKRVMSEAVKRGVRDSNPAGDIRGFRGLATETTHTALSKSQAKEMLGAIDRNTAIGKRDYAIVMVLLRTGLRRSELAALTLGDLSQEQGHNVLVVRHGKGDKRRLAKVPVDVLRVIDEYLVACNKKRGVDVGSPLFIQFDGAGKATDKGIGTKVVERVVKARAAAIGVLDLTPHGLRASFVTLTLEAGASLHQVQYAAGHADPRTTERYQKRKVNLDDNATDYLRF